MATQGIDIDFWAQQQTLNPARQKQPRRYSGYEEIGSHWSDFVPAIPLEERYASFKRRLAVAMSHVQ